MCALVLCVSCSYVGKKQNSKTLVAYYSWSETRNTEYVAKQIAVLTGGTLFEITPTEKYPTDFNECLERGRIEKDSNVRPALVSKVGNIDNYDTVFIGFPNWFGSFPMLIATFIEGNNFKDKVIIPFVTHGTGGRQNCFSNLMPLLSESIVLEGYSNYGKDVQLPEAKENVRVWIESLR